MNLSPTDAAAFAASGFGLTDYSVVMRPERSDED